MLERHAEEKLGSSVLMFIDMCGLYTYVKTGVILLVTCSP